MSDIVERLRAKAAEVEFQVRGQDVREWNEVALMREAADEIERLRRPAPAADGLQEALEGAQRIVDQMKAGNGFRLDDLASDAHSVARALLSTLSVPDRPGQKQRRLSALKMLRHVRVVTMKHSVQLWFGDKHIANVEPDSVAGLSLTRFADDVRTALAAADAGGNGKRSSELEALKFIEANALEVAAKIADARTALRGDGDYAMGMSDMAREIAEAIRDQKGDAAMNGLPMSIAPKDGSPIIAWTDVGFQLVTWAVDAWSNGDVTDAMFGKPTAWWPLPSRPRSSDDE